MPLTAEADHVSSLDINVYMICSWITLGRVLNVELYARRFQKLIYLHLFTGMFYEDFSSIVRRNTDGYTQ